MGNDFDKAVDILKKGGVIIFPTDTAFGIGCRIDRKESVERVFKIRKRPLDMPTPILVENIDMASRYLESLDKETEALAKKYWPGPLTIVHKAKKDKVLELVRGGGENVGVRVPDNKITTMLIKKLGVPLLGPSANFHGDKTPYSFDEINKDLIKLVDFVLEGVTKGIEKPSTVIDCSKKPWKILRNGALDLKF
jgi:L-threonylcarbamoyladenylate synthase